LNTTDHHGGPQDSFHPYFAQDITMLRLLPIILVISFELSSKAIAFGVSSQLILPRRTLTRSSVAPFSSQLFAASEDGNDKRKRRRRKTDSSQTIPPAPSNLDPFKTSLPDMQGIDDPIEEDLTSDDLLELARVAKFKFRPSSGEDISMPSKHTNERVLAIDL
jgi:hypothetical protein